MTAPSLSFQSLRSNGRSLGRDEHKSEASQMSFKKLKKEPFANKQEAQTYRQFFARRWSKFLHENFSGAAHVAMAFSVTAVTAQNWLDGMNAPQGWVVAKAMTDPELSEQAIKHLRDEPCMEFAAE